MKAIITFIFVSITISLVAQPPLPTEGYRWSLNQDLSDEFDGEELNTKKWQNTDPTRWIGRAPGLFMEEAVSLGEGSLRITTDKLAEPQTIKESTFTHQGGHVRSKNKVKPGSFIECRMKANKTFMSSTFWLINYSNEEQDCQKRTTELDIQECIGYPANKTQTERMGSNTHSRGVPTTCSHIPSGSVGNHCETAGKVYDKFFNYGVWWKSPKEILFFLDGEFKYRIVPVANFDIDLYIKMVCETYNWSPVPADGGMTGTWVERTTFYDWVRTYDYIEIEEPTGSNEPNSSKIFDEEILFTKKPNTMPALNTSFNINYKSNNDRKIVLELINSKGEAVTNITQTVYSGYGNMVLTPTNNVIPGTYTALASLFNTAGDTLISSSEYELEITQWATSSTDTNNSSFLYFDSLNQTISVNCLESKGQYKIHAVSGQLISSGKTDESNTPIDVSFLSRGSYIFSLTTDSGYDTIKFYKV